MSAKRINPRLIKLHRPYSVDEAARTLRTHKNTVRSWIKRGLPVVDDARPILILGHELRAFLEARRKAAKRPCPPGMLYCFKCRVPMPPALGMLEYSPQNASTGNLSALCGACGTLMHRRTRLDALPAKMPNLDVQIREAPQRLIGREQAPLNCAYLKD